MNDYLWNKEGSDPEIEALENSLSEFRIPAGAPNLPDTTTVQQFEPKRTWLSLVFAVPAFAALLIAALFFFGGRPENTQMTAANGLTSLDVNKAAAPQVIKVSDEVDIPVLKKPKTTKHKTPVAPNRPARTNVKKRRSLRPRKKLEPVTIESSQPKLTLEEEQAYAQLMRALTITSSKLKLVKDKVEGPEASSGTK